MTAEIGGRAMAVPPTRAGTMVSSHSYEAGADPLGSDSIGQEPCHVMISYGASETYNVSSRSANLLPR